MSVTANKSELFFEIERFTESEAEVLVAVLHCLATGDSNLTFKTLAKAIGEAHKSHQHKKTMVGTVSGCYFCSTPIPPINQAIESGWIPSFWTGHGTEDEEVSWPVCPMCQQMHLEQDRSGEFIQIVRQS